MAEGDKKTWDCGKDPVSPEREDRGKREGRAQSAWVISFSPAPQSEKEERGNHAHKREHWGPVNVPHTRESTNGVGKRRVNGNVNAQ